ncbi:hypothetical protein LQ564_09140 [Massilia sp. G4R7]|uniref:Methyl-accepting chemotaxis protein n=1 Tax=Massilia phyllostachyos TaxID=2898585 RepID=A0ABS8Q404_9BURK|nr:hypothetical protein [Massilia phyllostachyos]MCD2516475.1 hypothetical protein [Massilia phyllostachyos]
MATGWWSVLKTVPWSDVINAAPQVATGARRLWDTVARKSNTAPGPPMEEAPQEDPFDTLFLRVDKNEANLADLRTQMLQASEIIANLADQNAQLIAKMELARTRLLWLGVATGVSSILALVALALVMART